MGRQDSLEVFTLASELFRLGLNLDPAMNYHPVVSHSGGSLDVCVPSLKRTLSRRTVSQHRSSVDVKDPTVSLAESRQVITDTLNKLQTPSQITFRRLPCLTSLFRKDLGQNRSPGQAHKKFGIIGSVKEKEKLYLTNNYFWKSYTVQS